MSPRGVTIEKWHGAGNDFIVVDGQVDIGDRESFAIHQCDREHGIGADGVLFLTLQPDMDPPRVTMALVQPDGSTAAMCGNGARVAAQWASNQTASDTIIVETPAGDRAATITDDAVTVEMGEFSFDPASVMLTRDTPLIEEPLNGLSVTAVDTGVPHAVAFVSDVEAVELEEIAPPIRNDPVFREGANVTIAQRHQSGYRQRTFERGVEGETVACGTGAVAIAAVAYHNEDITRDGSVPIWPPGGELQVTIRGDETALLTGPVVKEFTRTIEGSYA